MRASASGRGARTEHNATNRGRTPKTFFPIDQGRWPDIQSIVTRSQFRSYAQSLSVAEVQAPARRPRARP